jgi:hypothetical protein
VTVIGRHEEESESGNLVNDGGSGPADFTFSPSLQTASVAGTITTRDARLVTVAVSREGTGAIESTSNTTTFPGFTGHFQASGATPSQPAPSVDGETLVDGSTTNAEIETLEDTNISARLSAPPGSARPSTALCASRRSLHARAGGGAAPGVQACSMRRRDRNTDPGWARSFSADVRGPGSDSTIPVFD